MGNRIFKKYSKVIFEFIVIQNFLTTHPESDSISLLLLTVPPPKYDISCKQNHGFNSSGFPADTILQLQNRRQSGSQETEESGAL